MANRVSQLPNGVSPEAIRLELQRILSGTGFVRSERISRFLTYTVEATLGGRADELKESVVGVAVYDRPADYNPKIDPIVRNEARRLRAKLLEYYETEGCNDPVIIDFPKGTYVPSYRERELLLAESQPGLSKHGATIGSLGRRKIAAIGLAAALLLVFGAYRFGRRSAPSAVYPVSIAVLPFINLGPNPGNDYLSDGLTEDVIGALAKVEGVRVPARTSTFAFKGKQQDIRDIGARLNVEMVLEGSVRQEGDKLRVTAQLNKVADGYHVWSATYDRDFKDALSLENDISEAIAATLRLKFARSSGDHTADPEAYNLYQRARYFQRQSRDPALQKKAIDYFNQAIAKDPNYALAYAGLSDARYASFISGVQDSGVAETAARKALQLDESLSEAHASLANALSAKRDWMGADKQYRRALELNPGNAKAHLDYATIDLALTDRLDQAIQETQWALRLDPISPEMYGLYAMLLIGAHRYDEAIDQARKQLEMDPRAEGPQNLLGRAYVQKGMLPEAEAEFAKAEAIGTRRAHWAASLAGLYVKLGRRADAEKMLATWSKRPSREFGHAESMAMIYAGLGNKDQAFQWLEEAYRESWNRLPWIKISPEYDSLRDDPRFLALLKKMALNSPPIIARNN